MRAHRQFDLIDLIGLSLIARDLRATFAPFLAIL